MTDGGSIYAGGLASGVAGRPGRWWVLGGAMAVTASIALAVVIVRVGVRQTTASRAYVDQPEYAVWGGLVLLGSVSLAMIGVVSLWWAAEIRSLPPNDRLRSWQIGLVWFGAAVALMAFQYAQSAAMPLDYPRSYPDALPLRGMVLGALSAFVLAVPTVAIWGLGRAAGSIDPDRDDAIERFSLLWSRQRDFLGALSALIVLVLLMWAAKLHHNNNFVPPEGPRLPEVPATYVLVLGALVAGLLLAIYLPPYYATRRAGEALATALCWASSSDSKSSSPEAWLAIDEKRQRYRTALGLAEGTRQHLERNAVLLAPLLTALLTTLLPDVST